MLPRGYNSTTMAIPILVIVGPTGSGKTDTAVQVARAVGGEILTADSMQVYRGMDIGTAKPTTEERQGIPHHLIDLVAPDEAFTVADYVVLADRLIAEIRARGRVPIVAGGTGFYISALLDRWEFPPQPADLAFRERMKAVAEAQGAETLHAQLHVIDPASAARLHVNDVKRVIRALEVHHLTGRPLSSFDYKTRGEGTCAPSGDAAGAQSLVPDGNLPYRPLCFGLTLPREVLYQRLAQRVATQLDAGLLDEVRRLHEHGYAPTLSSMKGITYRQLLGYLRGEYDFATAVALMVRDNRRYAKRQYTWFNADPRIHWLDLHAAGGLTGAVETIIAAWQQREVHSEGGS